MRTPCLWLLCASTLFACSRGEELPGDARVDRPTVSDGSNDTSSSMDASNDDTSTLDTPTPNDTSPALDALAQDANTSDITDASRSDALDANTSDVCVPSGEVCNGRDDNCNGQTDETGCPGHLLISEVVLEPNEAEYIEIYNPTGADVPLRDVYLTDFHDYARVIASGTPAVVPDSDFVARFPTNSMIPAGGYVTIATASPSSWGSYFNNACPTFYLQSAATLGTCTQSRAMESMPTGAITIGTTATLTNAGEPVTLFTWNGLADLVVDLDYTYVGAPQVSGTTTFNPQVDKSMQFVDGPDTDTSNSGYRLDTPRAQQQTAPLPARGAAAIRCNTLEGSETLSGGNGLWGHNETSEPLGSTWSVTQSTLAPDAGAVTSIRATPNAANQGCP